jgi:hypothetical protein
VRLVDKFADNTGRACRRYMQTATISRKPVQASAIVCKESGDAWRVRMPVFRNTANATPARKPS